jgi:hypothetical protein
LLIEEDLKLRGNVARRRRPGSGDWKILGGAGQAGDGAEGEEKESEAHGE